MKKIYITPKTKYFDVIEETLIATSSADSLSIDMGSETINEMSESLGRDDNSISGSSLWDQGW